MSERKLPATTTGANGMLETLREGLGRLRELLGLETPKAQPAYVPIVVRRRLPRRRSR